VEAPFRLAQGPELVEGLAVVLEKGERYPRFHKRRKTPKRIRMRHLLRRARVAVFFALDYSGIRQ
jgi:hypothetical protein